MSYDNNNQVDNRDMSIAVLRTFILRRKQEHEALLSKKNKSAAKLPENNVSVYEVDDKLNDSDMNTENSNEECEGPPEKSQDNTCTTSEEPVKRVGKVRGELKLSRVLEVILKSSSFFSI